MIKHFFEDDINAKQGVESVDRLKGAVSATYQRRQDTRASLLVEMQLLMGTLALQVQAEAEHHRRNGLFTDLSALGAYLSTSAPEFCPGSQYAGLAAQEEKDPRLEVAGAESMPSSVPTVSLAIERMRAALRGIDKDLRLYSHRVKHLRQALFMKDMALRELNKEKSAAEVV